MAQVRYNKTIFANGMIGKSTFGRTDSDYYKASVKKVTDGIIFPQGGIKNVTLDETLGVEVRQYERLFQIKKGKFIEDVDPGEYLIGQRKFSDTLDLLRVNFDSEGSITSVTYLDNLALGGDFKEYLIQIDDKIIASMNGSGVLRRELYFSDTFQKYGNTVVLTTTIEDANTFTIDIVTDKTLSGFSITGQTGCESATLDNVATNAPGDYTLTITATGCTPINEKTRQELTEVQFNIGDTVPNTYNVAEEDTEGNVWVGTLDKVEELEKFTDPVIIDEESDVPVEEETSTYKIYSLAYQRKGILPDQTLGLVTKYRVYRTDKYISAYYEGVSITAQARVAIQIQATIDNPVTAFVYPLAVIDVEVISGNLNFKSATASPLSDLMTYAPVNPNFKFIDKLLDDLGYSGSRYYGWNYDPINDFYEIHITSDSNYATEITIGGTPITQRPEMKETRIFGGAGRKVAGSNRKYKIIAIPSISTFDPYASPPASKIEAILPESLYCYSLLNVDRAKLAGKFDNRLVLTQFAEGNSIIAYSRLRNFFDFTFDGTSLNDAYISEFKDDLDLRIDRIIEHKSLVLFTNKGIYASSLLDTTFNPNSFTFKRVHTMTPNVKFPPEFLNGDLIFLDSTGSKLYAMIELKESSRYSIVDLTLFADDVFTSGVTVTTIDLAQQVGSEFVLVSAFGADGLVNFNSDSDILSWTTLNTAGIYTKVFTIGSKVYVYDLYSHKLTETKPKPSKTIIELLEPEIEFADGDKLSFHEFYKFEKAYVKIYGLFECLQVNDSDPMNWRDVPYKTDMNFVVPIHLEFSDNKDLIITMESDTDLILQSVSVIIDVD